MLALGMPDAMPESENKLSIISGFQVYMSRKNLSSRARCSGNPLSFLKCANGTLLPLSLCSPSATMPARENFYQFAGAGAMAGGIVGPSIQEERSPASPPMGSVAGPLDTTA